MANGRAQVGLSKRGRKGKGHLQFWMKKGPIQPAVPPLHCGTRVLVPAGCAGHTGSLSSRHLSAQSRRFAVGTGEWGLWGCGSTAQTRSVGLERSVGGWFFVLVFFSFHPIASGSRAGKCGASSDDKGRLGKGQGEKRGVGSCQRKNGNLQQNRGETSFQVSNKHRQTCPAVSSKKL